MDPEAKLQAEKEGHEFGTFCFKGVDEISEISPDFWKPLKHQMEHLEITYEEGVVKEVPLPLSVKQMIQLQKNDAQAKSIVDKLRKEKDNAKMFILHDGVLCRLWMEEKETFRCTFVPQVLRDPLLVLAHNRNGHNGGRRTYMALKKMYYWQSMKREVFKHCKTCKECMLQNQANTSGEFKHFKVPEVPMQLICMDLVGPIYLVTSRGNHFIVTCIDMLTGFTIAVPIKDKMASTVCDAYRAHVYCIFGGSARILTDNGTEFKNEQMDELCRQLNMKRVYSPVYTPEANGRLEAWHHFFKACVAKHTHGNAAEWDEVVPLAGAAYNFFPCQASGESPFVLMFGRDPITPFAKLLEPAPRYLGDRGGHLKMDLLRKLYLLTAENVKRAREGRNPMEMTRQGNNFKVNDLVLVRDPTSGAFAPHYMPNYRIVAVHAPNRITVRDEKGNETVRRASHLKVCDWKQKITTMVPDQSKYDKFGRSTKLLIHPKDIPNLQFNRKSTNKGEISPDAEISMIRVNITSGRDEYGKIPPKQLPIKVSSDMFTDKEKSVDILDLCEESGEFSPKVQNQVQNQMSVEERVNQSSGSRRGFDKKGNRNTWFYSPMDCVSKWSQALKQGVSNSIGLERLHTPSTTAGESEKPNFSFFL